jgi:hypothetical protein
MGQVFLFYKLLMGQRLTNTPTKFSIHGCIFRLTALDCVTIIRPSSLRLLASQYEDVRRIGKHWQRPIKPLIGNQTLA